MYVILIKSCIHKIPLFSPSRNSKLGKVVQLLVHNRADVNDVDPRNKNTALHYVCHARASSKGFIFLLFISLYCFVGGHKCLFDV